MVTLRSLGNAIAEDKCPPAGIYTVELTDVGNFEKKPALKFNQNEPDKLNIQSRLTYTFRDYPYDPDVDTQDWDGMTINDFIVFQKEVLNDAGEPVKMYDSYLDERSGANKLLKALMGRAPTREDELNLDEFIGTRIDVGIEPKDSGWPKFTSYARKRATRRPVEAAPAPAPKPIPADDDLTGTAFADDDE